jgi:chromate transporter
LRLPPSPDTNRTDVPPLAELFLHFAKASMSGFGGVLPFARRMVVEDRRWLSEKEFADLFSFCQFIPGANVVNLSVCIGARFHGPVGAAVALCGMLIPPTIVIVLIGFFYNAYGQTPLMQGLFRGLGATAAGLVVSTALKMGQTLTGRMPYVFAALAFAAIAWWRIPLLWMLAALAPVSIAAHWFWLRR